MVDPSSLWFTAPKLLRRKRASFRLRFWKLRRDKLIFRGRVRGRRRGRNLMLLIVLVLGCFTIVPHYTKGGHLYSLRGTSAPLHESDPSRQYRADSSQKPKPPVSSRQQPETEIVAWRASCGLRASGSGLRVTGCR
jgi:hypothetical protein